MHPRIRHKKLDPEPRTLADAYTWRRQALEQIERISSQLADSRRHERMRSAKHYGDWHKSASRALDLFRLEADLLAAWITARQASGDGPLLFGKAYDLLKTLQEDGVELEPEELDLITRLDALFGSA